MNQDSIDHVVETATSNLAIVVDQLKSLGKDNPRGDITAKLDNLLSQLKPKEQ